MKFDPVFAFRCLLKEFMLEEEERDGLSKDDRLSQ